MRNKILIAVAALVAVIVLIVAFSSKGKSPAVKEQGNIESMSAKELFDMAVSLEEKNKIMDAKATYQKILYEYPDFKKVDDVQARLEDINMKILFSAIQTPQTTIHEVVKDDTLGKIAKKYNTTVEFIKKSNNLKSDTIRIGQRLRIWQGTFSVYVDKSQNILILRSDDEVMKVYRVATGKNNITPVGEFKIVAKLRDPVWFKSGAVIPPDSSKNILGTRWLGFDIPGYGIHGTTEPESIGQQITAGCVRMRNEEVEELYSLLPVGTKVTIVD